MLRTGIGAIGRGYRHINRYRQILGVIFKFGLGDFLDNRVVDQFLEFGLSVFTRKRAGNIKRSTRAERLRMALEELGPTFVKLGQALSARSDLLPGEYIRELRKLQDSVPPFPREEVREIIRTETGKYPEEIFERFDDHPIAAASIAQVHRARLRDNGEVVVKVQRPGIRAVIEVDLEILRHLARMNERHLEAMGIDHPDLIVEEFARRMEREIDFSAEAMNIGRFARHFGNDPTVYIPNVFREFSTRRMLVMEYVNGIKASEVERLREQGYDLGEIARRGANLALTQVLVHGFFHADPHPGNIFILPGNVVCLLDFGAVGRISGREQGEFADLVMQVVRRDARKAAEALLSLTVHNREPDLDELERDTGDIIDLCADRSLKEIDIRMVFQHIVSILKRHRLSLKPHHYMMLMTLVTIEGLGRRLDPEFEIVRHAEPFIRRIHLNRLNPEKAAGEALHAGVEAAMLLRELPGELRALLKQARKGEIQIEYLHRGLEPMLEIHDRIASRITFAIVLASLVIGSSLMALSNIPPRWFDIPVIGLVGFVIAGIMGFWLLVSILRHRRM
ncbi:MAG: ABC1 kinase family protein [Candidatus Latescibacterota bacterium]